MTGDTLATTAYLLTLSDQSRVNHLGIWCAAKWTMHYMPRVGWLKSVSPHACSCVARHLCPLG